jgi:hypothetical protein
MKQPYRVGDRVALSYQFRAFGRVVAVVYNSLGVVTHYKVKLANEHVDNAIHYPASQVVDVVDGRVCSCGGDKLRDPEHSWSCPKYDGPNRKPGDPT